MESFSVKLQGPWADVNCVLSIMVLVGVLLPISTQAAPEGDLLELINDYRAEPPACRGEQSEPRPPLAPDPTLAKLEIDGGRQLKEAIRASDYRVARAESMTLLGPADAREAMRFAVQANCRLLLSVRYSLAGVSQKGSKWQIVLAQPLLDPDLGDWREAGQEVLKLVNAARIVERKCGNRRYAPAPRLSWSSKLAEAALTHSRDMAEHDYFGHKGSDGGTVGSRAREAAYSWRSIGENVAAGQGSAQQVVDSWLSSPGHCANIMNANFTEMGAAYATGPESDMGIYWTQVFGTPRKQTQ